MKVQPVKNTKSQPSPKMTRSQRVQAEDDFDPPELLVRVPTPKAHQKVDSLQDKAVPSPNSKTRSQSRLSQIDKELKSEPSTKKSGAKVEPKSSITRSQKGRK